MAPPNSMTRKVMPWKTDAAYSKAPMSGTGFGASSIRTRMTPPASASASPSETDCHHIVPAVVLPDTGYAGEVPPVARIEFNSE
ncbi:MAG TPA: hypothetical protein EYQ50_01030 [Verrucomicrobiales bacterium]|nr:hypothetical protein [Verrucomicrobiales bacterium]